MTTAAEHSCKKLQKAMHEVILVNVTPQETRVAIVQQGAVQELHIERALSLSQVGNLYLGKVIRVLPGLQSAFVDIGLERAAFLQVANVWRPYLLDPGCEYDTQQSYALLKPIEQMIFEGQTLMVQIIKDSIGTKGARLSTQISIAGRTLVYLPQKPSYLGISQKIENETEREALRARLAAVLPTDEKGGYIVRTIAAGVSSEELANDVSYLRKTWATICTQAQHLSSPALLYRDLDLARRVLRDFVNHDTLHIQVDSRRTFEQLIDFAAEFIPAAKAKLHHYTDELPIFDLYKIESEIQQALEKRVELKSGGYLIFDQTEAMTTIDVNTGGYVGGRNFNDTIFKTNLEAAQTITRQLRLRNLGGIIIIDFIDMENAEHRESVLNELKKALVPDRARISISHFSTLGLVEMTRKRTRESLAHLMCETCAVCHGKGFIKTPRTVCYEALREILHEAQQFNPRALRLVASPAVIELFLEEESQHFALLCDLIGKPIALQADAQLDIGQYEIVLN